MTRFRKRPKGPSKGIEFCDGCASVCDGKCRSDGLRREAVTRAGLRLL
jgi:hypothetical protein